MSKQECILRLPPSGLVRATLLSSFGGLFCSGTCNSMIVEPDTDVLENTDTFQARKAVVMKANAKKRDNGLHFLSRLFIFDF